MYETDRLCGCPWHRPTSSCMHGTGAKQLAFGSQQFHAYHAARLQLTEKSPTPLLHAAQCSTSSWMRS